jgi:hypothetical protein
MQGGPVGALIGQMMLLHDYTGQAGAVAALHRRESRAGRGLVAAFRAE